MENFIHNLIASVCFSLLTAVVLFGLISFGAWEFTFHWGAFRIIMVTGTVIGLSILYNS